MAGFLEKIRNYMLGEVVEPDDEMDLYEEDDNEDIFPMTSSGAKKTAAPEITSISAKTSGRYEPKSDSRTARKMAFISSNQPTEVVSTAPKSILDATFTCNSLAQNKICIVNLEGVERATAQRIADFICGSAYSLNCEIQLISNDIFVMANREIKMSTEVKQDVKSKSMGFSWSTAMK